MVEAASDLKAELEADAPKGVDVDLTGAPGMWSDFNEANKEAMLKSELISWPVTLAILVLAFGSLVAAGLPLMLTILGLISSAGVLYLGTEIAPISIWAMNFALMFALALGIDYALFVVMRFRTAYFGQPFTLIDAVGLTMDTAGKAVLFSAITVLASLSAVLLIPSPAFQSVALGIMVSVAFVLAATLTLLPAVLATLGRRVDKFAMPWVHSGERGSARSERWGRTLWRHPLLFGGVALVALAGLTLPVLRHGHGHALDHGRARARQLAAGPRADPGRLRRGGAGRAPGRAPGRADARGGRGPGCRRRNRLGFTRANRRRRHGAGHGGPP